MTESGTKFSGTNGFNRLVVPIPDSKNLKKGCILIKDWLSEGGFDTSSEFGIVTTGDKSFSMEDYKYGKF